MRGLLARTLLDPDGRTLGLLDATVVRNTRGDHVIVESGKKKLYQFELRGPDDERAASGSCTRNRFHRGSHWC
jgi:hypothetical protein